MLYIPTYCTFQFVSERSIVSRERQTTGKFKNKFDKMHEAQVLFNINRCDLRITKSPRVSYDYYMNYTETWCLEILEISYNLVPEAMM